MKQQEIEEQGSHQDDKKRTVQEMPIMGDVDDFKTTRTTNFSTAPNDEAGGADDETFRINDLELYRLLLGTITEQELLSTRALVMENEKGKNEELLKNCRNYLEVPKIFKDPDNAYLGVSAENAKDLSLSHIKPVPADKVRLVLEAFDENEQKENV